MIITCAIVDDEPLAAELLAGFIERIPFLRLVGTFHNALNAAEFIETSNVALLFMDIQMPHENGLQLLRRLVNKPMVIFTTAYNEYALAGFELDAIDYLLKPYDFERFERAASKARDYHKLTKMSLQQPEPFIFVKSDYQMVKVITRQIEYIEGYDDYIKIHTGERPILTLMSLKGMMEILPKSDFMRVHRSYIVPLARIQSVGTKSLKICGKEIPIGNTYADALHAWIDQKKNAVNTDAKNKS